MRRLLLLASTSAACSAAAIAIPAAASAAEHFYCGELVPAHTDCAISPGKTNDYYDGIIFVNAAEYFGGGTVSVCEHVYLRSTGATVSDRCKDGIATSGSDLSSYSTSSLSGHAGNNAVNSHTIYGTVVD